MLLGMITDSAIEWSLLGSKHKVFFSFLEDLKEKTWCHIHVSRVWMHYGTSYIYCVTWLWNPCVHTCTCIIHVLLLSTSDFSSSGWFAALMMAMLFFWQTQQRSLMCLVTMMWGSMDCHISQNVEYDTLWCEVESDSLYKSQTLRLVLDGNSCKSFIAWYSSWQWDGRSLSIGGNELHDLLSVSKADGVCWDTLCVAMLTWWEPTI